MSAVKAWRETVIIPTYELGAPEKYPVFLEKRVYQASTGAVYPHPVIEQISDEKIDKEWEVIFLENDFIQLMILPALGGRIQRAYDKIRKRDFVYYNKVIKPALVGLTGPWISGGIEFNWPQHHRPSTYQPTDSFIEENNDGSITVWVSELERMFRTKGMAGFTLHPDKAYLEIKAQLYNRTPHPQTFLWWANPAVAVNDQYQSVFPPDVNAVFDHGKRDVSEFPIAKGEYYKVDYSPGTDISRYKNIPVPTSYMAINSKYDFVGGYEHDTKGGLLHVANHHVSPGKKQWTWGNGDFGYAWDRNLTDEDGPYIELMCGVYTDNQPDFAWMQPYEEKSFRQYFMPYFNVGVVKNATKDALLNLEMEAGKAHLKIHVTGIYKDAKITLACKEQVFLEETLNLDPTKGFDRIIEIRTTAYKELQATVADAHGKTLVSWSPGEVEFEDIPEAAKATKEPEAIESVEELFLNGLHLEQYRHATFDATAYYLEGLKRSPGDVRCNNAMGLWKLKRGQFEEALSFFDRAIDTLTRRNPNPYDGEPYFNKGVVLNYLGRKDEAYAAFYKSCWNAAWQASGYFHVAQLDCENGDFAKALDHVDKALINNWHNHKARHLKVIILRKMGRPAEAIDLINDSLKIDRFNFGILFEKYLLHPDDNLNELKTRMRNEAHNYIELALDYAQAGQCDKAIQVLLEATQGEQVYPMIGYFLGYFHQQLGAQEAAAAWYKKAQQMPSAYCFPNRLEEVLALQAAIQFDTTDAKAPYYLGNFWYASRQYDQAQACWEASVNKDTTNAICHRNLALLYFNKTNQQDLARTHLEHAFQLDPHDARLLMELDQFYKKINVSIDERLSLLEDNLALTETRDDLYLERISLYNLKGQNEKALALMESRQFHPWEGGEGKVPFQHITIHIELAKKALEERNPEEAIKHLEAARQYPHNLGEGKLYGAQENEIFYYLGLAHEQMGKSNEAQTAWHFASEGLAAPSPAIFYNDQKPDTIFYQGLALRKLGRGREAKLRFEQLIAYGKEHKDDKVKMDYFAISLPDLLIWEEDLNVRNRFQCDYLIALGHYGLGQFDRAEHFFKQAFRINNSHQAIHQFLTGNTLLKNTLTHVS